MGKLRHTKKKKDKKSFASYFNIYMIVIGLSAPIMTIPQFTRIWVERHVDGLSIITWVAYTIFAGSWLIYGIRSKQKPIILTQIFLFPMDLMIVAGIILFRH